MKETVHANIGSLAFTLDEDAYRKLKDYLEAVGRHLPADDTDTIGDIECRIAEIFREKVSSPQRVVSITEVEEAIALLGAPEEFGAARAEAAEQTERPARRLFRSRSNRSIAGICGGLLAASFLRLPFYCQMGVAFIGIPAALSPHPLFSCGRATPS